MKKLVFILLAFAIGSTTTINIDKKELSIQKAEAGLLIVPWFFSGYRTWISDACDPDGFGEFLQCIAAVILGEEDENSLDVTGYISKDHVFVKKGVETRSGEWVQYDEPTRLSHNRLADDFVDYLENYREDLDAVEFSRGVEADDVMDKAEELAEAALKNEDFSKKFKTESDKKALKNFLKIQFGFKVK